MLNPSGLCKCGCGRKTDIIKKSAKDKGWVRGEPKRWISGHQRRPVKGIIPSNRREYYIWKQMLDRCFNPRNKRYESYGGRGITVSTEMQTQEGFIAVVGWRPNPELTLERLNNDGSYERGNVMWASTARQGRNKRNVKLTQTDVDEIKKTLLCKTRHTVKELAVKFGITARHVYDIMYGKSWAERAPEDVSA